MNTEKFTLTIETITRPAKNIVIFTTNKPNGFEFFAGQFIQFLIETDEKTVKRAYSFANTNTANNLEFCVKLLPNGIASEMVDKLEIGDTITINKPKGHFIQKSENCPIVCIGTGTGIAPLKSIIEDELLNKKNEASVKLLFGVRHEEDVFYNDFFENLVKKYDNFSYELTLSQPNNNWKGSYGRVTTHIENYMDDIKTHYYLCGSMPMVQEVRKKLMDAKVPTTQIHFEIY